MRKIFIIPVVAILLLGVAALLELYNPTATPTGNVVSTIPQGSLNQKILVGSYSIRPSFSVDLDYDLNVYDSIQEALRTVYLSCTAQQNLEACITAEVLKFNLRQKSTKPNYPLSIGCYENDEGSFMDALDYVSNCSSTQENNCQCNHQLNTGIYKLSATDKGIQVIAQINGKTYTGLAQGKVKGIITLLIDRNRENDILSRDEAGQLVQEKKNTRADCTHYQRKTYTFCYDTGKQLIVADENNKIVQKESKIKFAAQFP